MFIFHGSCLLCCKEDWAGWKHSLGFSCENRGKRGVFKRGLCAELIQNMLSPGRWSRILPQHIPCLSLWAACFGGSCFSCSLWLAVCGWRPSCSFAGCWSLFLWNSVRKNKQIFRKKNLKDQEDATADKCCTKFKHIERGRHCISNCFVLVFYFLTFQLSIFLYHFWPDLQSFCHPPYGLPSGSWAFRDSYAGNPFCHMGGSV